MPRFALTILLTFVLAAPGAGGSDAVAATSSASVASPFGGNGHNVSFDGRLFIARNGPDGPTGGWFATLLRPENIVTGPDGLPRFDQGAFSAMTLIQPFEASENALAICERDPAPYLCDEDGNRAQAGPYACYDVQVIDSDAYPDRVNALRMRSLKLWVSNPGTATAEVHKWTWGAQRTEMTRAVGGQLRGIEPTVTADGKLLIWQGHPQNDGTIDVLMYATNPDPCALDGWDGPHNFGRMFTDPNVNGTYPLGERALRAADGSVYGPNDLLRGAYPWVFPDGEAVNFTSVTVPCRAENDPAGCGPRRGGVAVIGYPTNWALAHVDGGINPDTDQTVRLFFSSPGPGTFAQLPATDGVDVWPMFGSNTQNYAEIVFDDGLNGGYGAIWHMNEMVDREGNLDRSRTPDVSGYFNTGEIRGATFPNANNAPNGKALVFDGTGDHVFVPHSSTLDPVNAITIEMRLRLDAEPDCDANNNYRVLLQKGNLASGSYSVVLEDSRQLHGRVNVGGEQRSLVSTAQVPVGQWVNVKLSYDGGTGELRYEFDGQEAGAATFAPGLLSGSTAPVTIGSPGGERAACPNGDGAFQGAIDEVRIARFDENTPDPDPDLDMGGGATDMGDPADMGSSVPDVSAPDTSDLGAPGGDVGTNTDEDPGTPAINPTPGASGCGCATSAQPAGNGLIVVLLALLVKVRRRRR